MLLTSFKSALILTMGHGAKFIVKMQTETPDPAGQHPYRISIENLASFLDLKVQDRAFRFDAQLKPRNLHRMFRDQKQSESVQCRENSMPSDWYQIKHEVMKWKKTKKGLRPEQFYVCEFALNSPFNMADRIVGLHKIRIGHYNAGISEFRNAGKKIKQGALFFEGMTITLRLNKQIEHDALRYLAKHLAKDILKYKPALPGYLGLESSDLEYNEAEEKARESIPEDYLKLITKLHKSLTEINNPFAERQLELVREFLGERLPARPKHSECSEQDGGLHEQKENLGSVPHETQHDPNGHLSDHVHDVVSGAGVQPRDVPDTDSQDDYVIIRKDPDEPRYDPNEDLNDHGTEGSFVMVDIEQNEIMKESK